MQKGLLVSELLQYSNFNFKKLVVCVRGPENALCWKWTAVYNVVEMLVLWKSHLSFMTKRVIHAWCLEFFFTKLTEEE